MAVAEELAQVFDSVPLLYVGARGGIEESLVPASGLRLEVVRSVKTSGLLGYARLPFAMIAAMRAAGRLLDDFAPDVVVALGGYASCPPALAARRRGLPVVVLEQNAIPGRVSRFLSRYASEIHATYRESVERFARPERVKVTGNPVRRAILDVARARRARGAGERLSLLVAGGSQGARRLNQLLVEALKRLEDLAPVLRVVHLAGRKNCESARRASAGLAVEVEVVGFEEDMAGRYLECDLVLSRAGATALAEISACGIPALLVPYPHAKDNHQEANARSFAEAGAARLLNESELNGQALADALRELLQDGRRRAEMAEKMLEKGRPGAGAEIARRLVAIAAGGSSA